MTVVAYVPDLMDRSKVAAAGAAVSFVATPAALVEAAPGATVAVVDLGRPGAVDALPALVATGVRVVAFGSHVDRDTLDAARSAGCQEVLPRSAFFRDLPSLLGRR
jgi:D-arabinose 1-dehydrogenase-like Zn-dependent alcohol dehydrogenase